jgi:phage recombination protein Bet
VTTKQTKTETKAAQQPIQDDSIEPGKELAAAQQQAPKKRSLAEQLEKRGISPEAWHTLSGSLFAGARIESILLVIDYCRARNLDPLKKPVHIVPMEVYEAATRQYVWRDIVLAGIYEHRTTAHRTKSYLGHTPPVFGETQDYFGIAAPAWCSMTFRRLVGERVAEFPVVVYFEEVCGTKYNKGSKETFLNARWARAPRQMLAKCTEAAGLREAFPEELGGEMVEEEADRSRVALDIEPVAHVATAADADEMNQELGLVADDDGAQNEARAAQDAADGPQL